MLLVCQPSPPQSSSAGCPLGVQYRPSPPIPVPHLHRLWLGNAVLVPPVAEMPEWCDAAPGMPQLARSTAGLEGESLRQMMRMAMWLGYRHFDIAFGNGHLEDIGTAL